MPNIQLVYSPDGYSVFQWQEHWKDFAYEHDVPASESDHWDWLGKSLFPGHVGHDVEFLIVAAADRGGDRCHGLMKLVWPKESRLAPGRSVLYVDYLEIAPWNRSDCPVREVTGLGTALIAHSVVLSAELGFEGRLALASLPQAKMFYAGLGMAECGFGSGRDHKLPYFEFDIAGAQRFLNRR